MCDKPYTNSDKWISSSMAGLLFVILSSPATFRLVDSITSRLGLDIFEIDTGCPNIMGSIIHSIVYTIILRFMMDAKHPRNCGMMLSSKDKWTLSLIGGLMFLLVSSPFAYQTTNSLTSSLGYPVAEYEGCPNIAGVVLHGVIFTLLARLMMR